jgi:hypothetical protein
MRMIRRGLISSALFGLCIVLGGGPAFAASYHLQLWTTDAHAGGHAYYANDLVEVWDEYPDGERAEVSWRYWQDGFGYHYYYAQAVGNGAHGQVVVPHRGSSSYVPQMQVCLHDVSAQLNPDHCTGWQHAIWS